MHLKEFLGIFALLWKIPSNLKGMRDNTVYAIIGSGTDSSDSNHLLVPNKHGGKRIEGKCGLPLSQVEGLIMIQYIVVPNIQCCATGACDDEEDEDCNAFPEFIEKFQIVGI